MGTQELSIGPIWNLRKLNYPINYRYGINLKIDRNPSHVVLLILLAGDVATNPGPCTTPPRTTESSPGPDDVTNIHYMRCMSVFQCKKLN
jgi:hypothetical protein